MRLVLILIVVILGLAAGLGLTAFSIGSGAPYLVRQVQGWEFSPRIGSTDIDPYARARLFSEGELPLASGEGYALRARRDADGMLLEQRCHYRLASPFPTSRYWTVALTDPSGRVVPNLSERTGFTSAEIIRSHEGHFTIEIAPEPQAGNWLPTGRKGERFELALRFYETPLAATATLLDTRLMPTLRKIGCES